MLTLALYWREKPCKCFYLPSENAIFLKSAKKSLTYFLSLLEYAPLSKNSLETLLSSQ